MGDAPAIPRTRLALAVLVVAFLAAPARADREAVEFRLRKDPEATARGWLLECDEEGFRFERFGGQKREYVPWDALVAEDAKALRLQFHLDWAEHVEVGTVSAHRLRLVGGGEVIGLLVRVDEQQRYWVKREGVLLPYPGARIAGVEPEEVSETVVFDRDEIYRRRLLRQPPKTAPQHRDLADYMFDLGNWEKAADHYAEAGRLRAAWADDLKARQAEIEAIRADEKAAAVFRKAMVAGNLHDDYSRAIRLIEDYVAANPDVKRRGVRLIDELRARMEERVRARFTRVKHEEFDRVIERYLVRHAPTLADAKKWVLGDEMRRDLAHRVAARLGLSPEDYERLLSTEPRGAPHWASYWSGTHLVAKRTHGKSTERDGEDWWDTYDDTNTRSGFLKAFAAERLPALFEVLRVRTVPCERCGGEGRVTKMSFIGRPGVGNEWLETCPRCHGVGEDRSVAYR